MAKDGRRDRVLSVRISADLLAGLDRLAKAEDNTRTGATKRALRAGLRVLGVLAADE